MSAPAQAAASAGNRAALGRVRGAGELAYVLAVGACAGLPIGALVAWLAMSLSGREVSLAPGPLATLAFIALGVGAPLGVVIAHDLWVRGERRAGRSTWLDEAADVSRVVAAIAADEEEARLAALATRLRQLGQRDPAALHRRTMWMAALGYSYVAVVVAAFAGATWIVATAWDHQLARLAPIFAFATLHVLLTLRVRFDDMPGVPVPRVAAPALHREVETLARAMDVPMPDAVMLDAEVNAAAQDAARWGPFGPTRRTLLVGAPLLAAMTPEEARAILAHEMAHLSRAHSSRLSTFIRLATTWRGLTLELEANRPILGVVFRPFLRWYSERFSRHVDELARLYEHESDALAARHAGGRALAMGLLRLAVWQRFATLRVLPALFADAARSPEPPADALPRACAGLRGRPSPAEAGRWARQALDERTVGDDTHPALRERLARLGFDEDRVVEDLLPDLLVAERASGLDALLGDTWSGRARTAVAERYTFDLLPAWRELHSAAAVAADPSVPRFDAMVAHARFTEAAAPGDALALWRHVLAERPSDTEARMRLAAGLVAHGEGAEVHEGVALLEDIAAGDHVEAIDAAAALERWYTQREQDADAARVRTRGRQLRRLLVANLRDRLSLSHTDHLEPHPLGAADEQSVREACAVHPEIRAAYVVRKATRAFRESPAVRIVLELDVPWYRSDTGDAVQFVGGRVAAKVVLPGVAHPMVFAGGSRNAEVALAREVPGACVYRREEHGRRSIKGAPVR